MILKLFKNIASNNQEQRRAELYRNLIRHEAQIGGTLFGPVPNGGKREFFCLDERTWVWHEEWMDESGQYHSKNIRYDVRPNGILKTQDGGSYQNVSDEEAQHLREAVILYTQKVQNQLYANV